MTTNRLPHIAERPLGECKIHKGWIIRPYHVQTIKGAGIAVHFINAFKPSRNEVRFFGGSITLDEVLKAARLQADKF